FTALEGLEAGITYTIEITAANGCKTTLDQLILEPAPIAAIDLTVEPFVCVVGNNGNHASITVNSATGGTGTYVRYEFINNDGNVVVQNGSNNTYIETNTAGGDYTINLYDSNGCVGTTTATIDPFD